MAVRVLTLVSKFKANPTNKSMNSSGGPASARQGRKERAALLMSAPGVRSALSATLLAELPEPVHLDRGRLAALVGVVPLCSTRRNPAIREFYGRLVAAVKPKKVALTACKRKLLTTLTAVLRNGGPRPSWHERGPRGADALPVQGPVAGTP